MRYRCPLCGEIAIVGHDCVTRQRNKAMRETFHAMLREELQEPLVPWDVSSLSDQVLLSELTDPAYVRRMVNLWERGRATR